ncbi:MAG TPA: acyl-CoA dehydrogenase family protein, partial [Anaerolineae bacterium]
MYLPRLAAGDIIGCYCLTEPNAGSDAGSIETTAIRDGDVYNLNGEKIWITNGGIAQLSIVFASMEKALGHKGICAFLVATDTPGFRRTPMDGEPLGHRASDHAHIHLENVRVPATALLGTPGEGFSVAMSALDHGRLGVAAGALGVAQACLDASVEFARTRKQFGKRIGDFEMIQAEISEMGSNVEAARMLVYRAAWVKDQGRRNTREVSMAKLF